MRQDSHAGRSLVLQCCKAARLKRFFALIKALSKHRLNVEVNVMTHSLITAVHQP